MKLAGYKRADTEEAAKKSSATLRFEAEKAGHQLIFFAWDLPMGQRGFLRVKRAIEADKVQGVIVEDLRDLGRDLTALVKALDAMMSNGAEIISVRNGLRLVYEGGPTEATPEARTIAALAFAQCEYSINNRKAAIAAARAAGAHPGRPTVVTLEEATPTIEEMAEDGNPPTVRKLAKRLDCSEGTAATLLRRWKANHAALNGAEQC